jgi:hypothetical protein
MHQPAGGCSENGGHWATGWLCALQARETGGLFAASGGRFTKSGFVMPCLQATGASNLDKVLRNTWTLRSAEPTNYCVLCRCIRARPKQRGLTVVSSIEEDSKDAGQCSGLTRLVDSRRPLSLACWAWSVGAGAMASRQTMAVGPLKLRANSWGSGSAGLEPLSGQSDG